MTGRLVLALLPALLAAAEPNTLSREESRQGWTLLFDGSQTGHWLDITGKPFPSACWTVENGCLKAFANPAGVRDIRTKDTYRDFEFAFEWKIARAGNSGVKYLIQRTDEWNSPGTGALQARARGFEYQLTDDANSAERARDASRGTGSLYSVLAPQSAPVLPAGEFNRSRIVVRGDHVEHWLNGVKVLEFELPDPRPSALAQSLLRGEPAFRRAGPISLQNHSSDVWFRSLKIRRLD